MAPAVLAARARCIIMACFYYVGGGGVRRPDGKSVWHIPPQPIPATEVFLPYRGPVGLLVHFHLCHYPSLMTFKTKRRPAVWTVILGRSYPPTSPFVLATAGDSQPLPLLVVGTEVAPP